MKIDYIATQDVHEVLASLGRTEDLRLSPNNRCLAIAAFSRQKIALFDIAIDTAGAATRIALSNARLLSSAHLRAPHGLDFVDDEHLLVANREGQLCLFSLPTDDQCSPAEPLLIVPQDTQLASPGSLAVQRIDQRLCEVLVCNNSGNTVTRHLLDYRTGAVEESGLLLDKWLDIPDGIAVSGSRQWLAVSNHNLQNVMLYANPEALPSADDPQGILGSLQYPHGIRFTRDDRHVLVADAGAPYVHVYRVEADGWHGLHNPYRSIRIIDDEDFRREHKNPQEGGPKGIDLDQQERILAVTCSGVPLAFFDLSAELVGPAMDARDICAKRKPPCPQTAVQVLIELERQQQNNAERKRASRTLKRAAEAEAKVRSMENSRSWRLTAPLRWLTGSWRREKA